MNCFDLVLYIFASLSNLQKEYCRFIDRSSKNFILFLARRHLFMGNTTAHQQFAKLKKKCVYSQKKNDLVRCIETQIFYHYACVL